MYGRITVWNFGFRKGRVSRDDMACVRIAIERITLWLKHFINGDKAFDSQLERATRLTEENCSRLERQKNHKINEQEVVQWGCKVNRRNKYRQRCLTKFLQRWLNKERKRNRLFFFFSTLTYWFRIISSQLNQKQKLKKKEQHETHIKNTVDF